MPEPERSSQAVIALPQEHLLRAVLEVRVPSHVPLVGESVPYPVSSRVEASRCRTWCAPIGRTPAATASWLKRLLTLSGRSGRPPQLNQVRVRIRQRYEEPFSAGVYNIPEVAERLGHDPATLMRYYTRVNAVRRQQATDHIADLIAPGRQVECGRSITNGT